MNAEVGRAASMWATVNDCLDCGKKCEPSNGRARLRCIACAKARIGKLTEAERAARRERIRARKAKIVTDPDALLGSVATMAPEVRFCLRCNKSFIAYMPAARYHLECFAELHRFKLRKDVR